MAAGSHAEPRGVPVLLALLASSIEQEGRAAPLCEEDAAAHEALSRRNGTTAYSTLRIRGLRRSYNILLFGGPSHDEIVEQAALEDSSSASAGEVPPPEAKLVRDLSGATPAGAGKDDDDDGALALISSSVSAALLELRRARRFDPANALEGLVDQLIARHGAQGTSSVAHVLRLFAEVRRGKDGGRARDADDWEVIGGHGRRVLEALYISGGDKPLGVTCPYTKGEVSAATTANLAVPAFFRHRGGRDGQPGPGHTQAAPSLEFGDAVAETTPKTTAPGERYLLPNDCVLHGDSAAASSSGFGSERMPWFKDSAFSSARGIPDLSERSSLDRYLEAMAIAPLSPTAWTKICGEAGGENLTSSLAKRGSGGDPAVPAARGGTVTAGGSRVGHGLGHRDLDLCGALSQARVDARSPMVRELRLALSFPDLTEGSPPDLLKAVQVQLRGPSDPTNGGGGGGFVGGEDLRPTAHGDFPFGLQPARPGIAPSSCGSKRQQYLPARSRGRLESVSKEGFAPPWDCSSCDRRTDNGIQDDQAGVRLDPVGWEQAEGDWKDPSVPKWALASAPLATGEGGPGSATFELCYRDHFGGGRAERVLSQSATADEAEMVRNALAAVQGIPSGCFWHDVKHACMRVSGFRAVQAEQADDEGQERELRRVPGLSRRTLASMLEDFARAGTWYRRVEEFALCAVDRSAAVGQVAQAFGVELRRQLTVISAAILAVAADFTCQSKDGIGRERDTPCSLTDVLIRTAELRRALLSLAEVCGLADEKLEAVAGVRDVFMAFPRGASLLTYIYRTAELRAASSRPGRAVALGARAAVTGDRDSVLALLRTSAAPYLAMLGRWLWSGEMWVEDDPCEEFPLRCRARDVGSARVGAGGGGKMKGEPWMEDGGGSFLSLAFCENETAGIPCFLEGGVLTAAARAGKLLRMLKLSSPEFYTACAASPPPPLSLVFGSRDLASREAVFTRLSLLRAAAGRSAARGVRARAVQEEMRKRTGGAQLLKGEKSALRMLESERRLDRESVEEARRNWIQGLKGDRAASAAAAAATAAAEKASPATASGGRGILSFLEPPTSEAEAFAAAALRERYRVLEEEVDARAARARWKRRQSERSVAARASLKALYAEEAYAWKIMASAAAAAAGSRSVVSDEALHIEGDGGTDCGADEASVKDANVVDGDGSGWVEAKAPDAEVEGATLPEEERPGVAPLATLLADQSRSGDSSIEPIALGEINVVDVNGAGQGEEPPGSDASVKEQESSGEHESHSNHEVKFSHVTIVEEPGGASAGVAAALGTGVGVTREGTFAPLNDPPAKFSHVTIVQEPGGSSSGMSMALGKNTDGDGAASDPLSQRTGVRMAKVSPGQSSGVSDVMAGGSTDAVATVKIDDLDGCESRPSATHGPGESSTSMTTAAAGIAATAEACSSRQSRDCAGDVNSSSVLTTGESANARGARVDNAIVESLPTGLMDQRDSVPLESTRVDADAAREQETVTEYEPWRFLPETKEERDRGEGTETDSLLPLEVLVRRCVREPVLAQCCAVDSAALAFLVRGAGVAEHLASLRMFLLGLNSDFLPDFTLRLLEGLYDGGVDWRRPSNLNAAFAASATAAGLDSVPLAETFRYEVDPTCGGVLGRSFSSDVDDGASIDIVHSPTGVPAEVYSPAALSFVSPVLAVTWPVGVILPTGVLHTYGSIHRCLFRHQLVLHRLRRLRLTLRELDTSMDTLRGGPRDGPRRGVRRAGRVREETTISWDRGRLHWVHLFRHEMQHMADSLQTFFAERAETGWPDLRRSFSAAEGEGASARAATPGGGLALLVAAHSRYIFDMHLHMFLGADRPGGVARAAIEDFYDVICTVGRVTDGLLPDPAFSRNSRSDPPARGRAEGMLLPDGAFAELATARKRFDAARQGICGALLDICAAGGSARARPLLTIIGYGGYESGRSAQRV